MILTLALLSASVSESLAWSGGGHSVIAAGAYRELPKSVRRKVDALLQSHPEYPRWKKSYAGESAGMDLGQFIFMQASKWPDEIRGRHNQYDHPHWHYVNYPLKTPGFSFEPSPTPDDDILFGIHQSEKMLADKHNSPEVRAVYLSWLIHLIGDLHQPLHTTALVNAMFPKGDKGGNDFYVMPASKGIRLHSFWDQLLGTRNQARSQANYAAEIKSHHWKIFLRELKHKTVEQWSLESRALAIDKAYLHGKLKGSTDPETAPPLPRGYTKEAKSVAERQAVLAMYRLAGEIKTLIR